MLYSWKPFSSFASVNDEIELPPGYERALRYNLAVELYPEYGKEPPASIYSAAQESKAAIKRMNIKPSYLVTDPFFTRRPFNILTGDQ